MTATLINRNTGEESKVHATTEHPTSSYGKAVWVDEQNNAYLQVGSTHPLFDIVLDEPYATRLRIDNNLHHTFIAPNGKEFEIECGYE